MSMVLKKKKIGGNIKTPQIRSLVIYRTNAFVTAVCAIRLFLIYVNVCTCQQLKNTGLIFDKTM